MSSFKASIQSTVFGTNSSLILYCSKTKDNRFVSACDEFIEAAEVLKTERIKLPADANIEEDDMMFPPICLARLNRGVPVAPQGRPRRRRINGVVRRCGNCNQPGHKRTKCRYNSVWFDWNDANDYPFREVYRRSIRRVQ